jgi:hypothetical protein
MNSKQAKITFRAPQSLAKDTAARAASRGCSQSALIVDALQKAGGKEIGNDQRTHRAAVAKAVEATKAGGKEIDINKRKHLAAVDKAMAAIQASHPGVKLGTRIRLRYETDIIACRSDGDRRVVGEIQDEDIELNFPGHYRWRIDEAEES